jgi:hypothetical protein
MLLAFCTIACSLARQPCPAALPGSFALQPFSAGRQFDQFRLDLMRALACSAVTALYYSAQWQVTKLHARAAVLTGLNLF